MLIALIVITGCSANYRMVSRIHRDGTLKRDVYVKADSAYLSGKRVESPFLFELGNHWQIERLNPSPKFDFWGQEEAVNVKAHGQFNLSIDSVLFRAKASWATPLGEPQEHLTTHFRWFYTYYEYTCRFPELTDKGPIPLGEFLTIEEQRLWFQGHLEGYGWMNGIELKDKLDEVSGRFEQWYTKTMFTLRMEQFIFFLRSSNREELAQKLLADQDTIYRTMYEKSVKERDESPEQFVERLDHYYRGSLYQTLYEQHKSTIDSLYDRRFQALELFGHQIKFECHMPGQVLWSNASINTSDSLVWKVDAYRLLYGDYTLRAQSRVLNVWSLVLTGILLLIALSGILIKRKKRG